MDSFDFFVLGKQTNNILKQGKHKQGVKQAAWGKIQ